MTNKMPKMRRKKFQCFKLQCARTDFVAVKTCALPACQLNEKYSSKKKKDVIEKTKKKFFQKRYIFLSEANFK